MTSRLLIVAIALVICIPLVFAALGTSEPTGLMIGAILVVVGVAGMLLGARRSEDDG